MKKKKKQKFYVCRTGRYGLIAHIEFSPMVTLCCCVCGLLPADFTNIALFFFPQKVEDCNPSRRNHVDQVKIHPIRDCVYNEHSLRRAPLFTISLPIKKASPATLLCYVFSFYSLYLAPLLAFRVFFQVQTLFTTESFFFFPSSTEYISLLCNMIWGWPLCQPPPYAERKWKKTLLSLFSPDAPLPISTIGSVTIVHLVSSCRSIW